MIKTGLKNEIKFTVSDKETAKSFGSGELDVLATPKMIALMEEASYKCIAPYLEDGISSVGTLMNVKHLSATPVGMEVTTKCEVIDVQDRKIVFKVEAYDEKGLIGEGEHERFLVKSDKFTIKAYAKLDK
jgi:predicted thioesterase